MTPENDTSLLRNVPDARTETPVDPARLTPTQLKVLHGVRSGLLNKQIAFDLGITEKTVKAHMTALMRKMNVRNRTQVAIAAYRMQPAPGNDAVQ